MMLGIAYRAILFSAVAFAAGDSIESAKVPKELYQYVQSARSLGLQDGQIRETALNAGWKAPVVDATLTATRQNASRPAPGATAAPGVGAPGAGAPGAGAPDAGPPLPEVDPDEYQIGPGDVLQVMVWKEPDASVPAVVVRPDGKIAMPLLKQIGVAGMTPRQAETAINARLSEFIHGVDVTVVVTKIDSKKVYLIGAVKKEGPMPLPYRMTVLQALSEGGGLTDYAKRRRIYVLRVAAGKQYRYPFNYDQVIKGEQPEQNIWVQPGDTIVVPR